MRITLTVDEKLLTEALLATGARTKREVIELGLEMVIRLAKQRQVRRLRGTIQWARELDPARNAR
jgi:Arc/MetJ family transcription regulator